MNNLRILHFAHSFIPKYGGTTTRLCNLLSDKVNTHYLYVPQPKGRENESNISLPSEEDFNNIKLRRCKIIPKILFRPPIIGIFERLNANRMVCMVKDSGIDIVHGHNPAMFARAALKSSRILNVPFIYEVHRLPFDSFGSNRKYELPDFIDTFIRWCYRLEEGTFLSASAAVIVQTQMHKDRILSLFEIDSHRINVIPMGVDEEYFNPLRWQKEGITIKNRLDCNDKVVFMFNGYLGHVNGIELFLSAVQELPGNIKRKMRVVLLGRGPFQEKCERICKCKPDLFQYLGFVKHTNMPQYYSATDVVVIPLPPMRVWDCNNPTKLLEAMAMEKVILGSDVRGNTDLLKNGTNGFTFKSGSKKDLIKQIIKIIENFHKIDPLRKMARYDVTNKRTWSQSRARLHDLYLRVKTG